MISAHFSPLTHACDEYPIGKSSLIRPAAMERPQAILHCLAGSQNFRGEIRDGRRWPPAVSNALQVADATGQHGSAGRIGGHERG